MMTLYDHLELACLRTEARILKLAGADAKIAELSNRASVASCFRILGEEFAKLGFVEMASGSRHEPSINVAREELAKKIFLEIKKTLPTGDYLDILNAIRRCVGAEEKA